MLLPSPMTTQRVVPMRGLGLLAALGLAGLPLAALPLGAQADPVVCTTTLEAPSQAGGQPLEVSRCGAVVSVPQLVEQRFFTYTAPYAEGVSIRGQVRDLFGVATGSVNSDDSLRVFGFPDQTIVWDGTALQNTYDVLLEAQSDPMPWRTADLGNGFDGSLGSGAATRASSAGRGSTLRTPVRGLW